jgi:pimeloyl-ACP methyl ester carboxylesterase
VEKWRRAGAIEVFHYAYNEPRRLRFSFYEDAVGYAPASRRLAIPMLIFQGRRDESVEPASVERFARAQSSAVLHMLDDGHQLKDSLEFVWREIQAALTPVGDRGATS